MITKDRLWYKDAVFYELYVRAYKDTTGNGHGDLQGVIEKLPYIKSLGVDCIWILPIYPSPLEDDGYDIADYYGIHPDYGTLEDFKELITAAHEHGLRLIADLVLNHTSDQHPWFQMARRDRNSPYRDYYVWSDTNTKYAEARIIFVDTEESNWTWDETAGQYYWHRFYSSQPDLNYDNPAVQAEMFRVIDFWLNMGIDGFRADAVPYLFEREGTNCENLPETHLFLKQLRRYLDEKYPDRVLLCEANQWPEDVWPYFGTGDEFHMGFHFPVMPRIYISLRKSDVTPLVWILDRTPPIPPECQWCTFLRNHDELTLEMVTEEERQWMWEEYAPEPRMRLNLGIRRRLAPLLDNDRRKIELANSLLFTLPGSPIIYYGDEIGMGDNIWLPDRNGVRTPMQWDSSSKAGFSEGPSEGFYAPVNSDPPFDPQTINVEQQQANPDSLINKLKAMIRIRKAFRAFGRGAFTWLQSDNTAVAAYLRKDQDEHIAILNNLSGEIQQFKLNLPPGTKTGQISDLITGETFSRPKNAPEGEIMISLRPYQYMWLELT
jgi:maltose alpha-D-glucosyltransferase/alpha-amylase